MPTPRIVPAPKSYLPREGAFTLDDATTIHAADGLDRAAHRLRAVLFPATQLPLAPAGPGANQLRVRLDGTLEGGPEAYAIDVREDRVELVGASELGALHAIQTLRQLLPTAVFSPAAVADVAWRIACARIDDAPRFRWRGGHLDVGRHFMPKDFVLRYVDLLAMHKLNRFHFHLTEDQGWRIEIRKYPRLTEVGAWREGTRSDWYDGPHDGVRHGGFYTQAEIREIVAYASERGVTVVPEIEMPGHARAAIAAYPRLGNNPDVALPVPTRWGIFDQVMSVEPRTLDFCRDVLEEVVELFPSEWIHTGGDEAPRTEWKASPAAQARMRELGIREEAGLQTWFHTQIAELLAAHGRRMVGWDEIVEGGLPPGAIVMDWLAEGRGVTAARLGHEVIATPQPYTYFNAGQQPETDAEGESITADVVYDFEPVPGDISPAEAERYIGTQFQVWTEYVPTPQRVEWHAYPRACAFAEMAWLAERDAAGFFVQRLPVHLERLERLGVNFCRG